MIKEFCLEYIACKLIQWEDNKQLTKEGNFYLHQLVRNVLYQRKLLVSQQMDVLKGFATKVEGLNQLRENFRDRQFACVINHFADCPAGIVGNAIFTAHSLREATNIEPYIVEGTGFSIISSLRRKINNSTNIILVDGKSGGSKIIMKAITEDKKSIVLYPEGINSTGLKMANFKAGRLMSHIVEAGIPIICAGIYFRDNTFFFKAGGALSTRIINMLSTSSEDLQESGQRVANYAMQEIAKLLPEDLRGFYK